MIVNDVRFDGSPDPRAISDTVDPGHVGHGPVQRRAVWSRFDRRWYLGRNPDVASQMQVLGIADPEQFYHEYGARLGHSPNMFFDEEWYLRTNPDVSLHVERGTLGSGVAH